jgi:hypothetical protein
MQYSEGNPNAEERYQKEDGGNVRETAHSAAEHEPQSECSNRIEWEAKIN